MHDNIIHRLGLGHGFAKFHAKENYTQITDDKSNKDRLFVEILKCIFRYTVYKFRSRVIAEPGPEYT